MGPGLTAGERARGRRLAPAHLVMLAAGLLGGLLTLVLLRAADERVPVVAAARDLPAGATVARGDLTTRSVGADAAVLGRLVDGADLDDLVGRVAGVPLVAGDLVSVDDLEHADVRLRPRAMSFPVPRSRAVAGAIDAGDVVDVVAVDRGSGVARLVLSRAEVLSVDAGASGRLVAGDDVVTITLAVERAAALELAGALEAGTVTLVRATGSDPVPTGSDDA